MNLFSLALVILCISAEEAHAFGKRPLTDELDSQIQSIYPEAGQSAAQASATCQKLTDFAQSRGVSTLVIGYEGLLSFDSSGTHVAYRQHLEVLGGQTPEPMRGGSGGYLLHGLLEKVIRNQAQKVEVLVFPHTATGSGSGSVPETCAEVWMREAGNRLIVLGHSYGGHAASQLVDALAAKKIPVDVVITADPRLKGYIGKLERPATVRLWENYFQKNTPFLNGYLVVGADLNSNISSTGVAHVGVPYSPILRSALERALGF